MRLSHGLARTRSVESFAHLHAKHLMTCWLRAAAAHAGAGNDCNATGISWRVNRPGPNWGVWQEYGFVGQVVVWDETSDKYVDRPPTYAEMIASGHKVGAIADIAIQHKGTISHAIELTHRHKLTEQKRAYLEDCECVDVLEIPVSWVLNQVTVPDEIPARFFLTRPPITVYRIVKTAPVVQP